MTLLTIPIVANKLQDAFGQITRASQSAGDCVELRLDLFDDPISPEDVTQLVMIAKQSMLTVVVTCRPVWEGGQYDGGEEVRFSLLQSAADSGADYIDIELLALENNGEIFLPLLDHPNIKVIVSNHDFDMLPDDLVGRQNRMNKYHGVIRKLAYMPADITESFSALDLLYEAQQSSRGQIAMAMGASGLMSRLLAKKLSASVTFSCLTAKQASAPGQVDVAEMDERYLWSKQNKETLIYGVIGSPIGHSMSPAIHNGAFLETNFNGLYIPLLVDPSQVVFDRFIDSIVARRWLDMRGFSVTIPHKQHALAYVIAHGGYVEPLAKRIGAVNTLIIDEKGALSAFNTDYSGSLDAICEIMGIERADFNGLPVAIMGAGGVARALVAGLVDNGARVTICNRTVATAAQLASSFDCTYGDMNAIYDMDAKLIINCTSLGMHPNTDTTAVNSDYFKKDMAVFDTVYNPQETTFLREAKAAGCKTIDGVTMFVNQAADQFKMFTGLDAPKAIMRKVVEANL